MRAGDDADDDALDAALDDAETVVMSQAEVKRANIRAMVEGTLVVSVGAFADGLLVRDPRVVLKRAFKSPLPNAPDRSGAWR